MTEMTDSQLAVRLPWQGDQWLHIEQLLASDRMPHALLFSGPDGIGKGRFALALAHYLMCEQPVSGTACGQCRQCGFNRAATHPDLQCIEPDAKGKQIKVDQVREVVQFLGHTAQQGGYKIAIIQPAEAMNINAANALLKCLEEPAGQTLLILITDSPSRLLATIRSRCQSLLFPTPEPAAALTWLSSVIGTEASQAKALMTEAQGRPLAAMALLQADGLERSKQLDADYMAMLEGRIGAVSLAEKWLQYELADVLQWLNQRLTALVSGVMAGSPVAPLWEGVVSRIDARVVYALMDKSMLLQQQIRSGANPNHQLALEDLLLFSCDKLHN